MSSGADVYRRLLADRQVRRLLAGLVLSSAITAEGLAVVLAVSEERGVAQAGLVAGAFAITLGFSAPVRGRIVDRRGQGRVLLAMGVPHAVALIALALTIRTGAPLAALIAAAVVAGISPAPLGSSLRSLWAKMVGEDDERQLEAAYSFHSVVNELLFIFGPLLVGAAVVLTNPIDAMLIVAVSGLIGVVVFATSAASRAETGSAPSEGSWVGPVASAGMRTLMFGNIGLGALFGALDVAVAAFADERGSAGGAGIAIAALAIGSMVGGLAYGAHVWRSPPERRLLVLFGLMTLALLPLPAATSLLGLSVLMAVGGLAVAPFVATEFRMVDFHAPLGTATEAMSWIGTTYSFGIASGAVLAGLLAEEAGARAALALAAAFSGLAFAVTAARFRTLRTGREMVV